RLGASRATCKTAGSQSLTATDTLTSSLSGSQSGISVVAAAASTLIVTGFPASITAGVAATFSVTARDVYGNLAAGYTGTLHFTSSDTQAALPVDYTFTSGAGGDNGVHIFSAALKTAGGQSLTATDTLRTSLAGS